MADPSHVITPDAIQLKENLSFEVPPMSIGERSTKLLRGKEVRVKFPHLILSVLRG
jgi:hypothetical protein